MPGADELTPEQLSVVAVEVEQAKKRKSKPDQGIALCLSGGGYRAALYHLGVLRCLADTGILRKVRAVSSVSGGSILSSYIARRLAEDKTATGIDFSDWGKVSSDFRKFVLRDIRTVPVLSTLPFNWLFPSVRVALLQGKYGKFLLTANLTDGRREMTLGDLPAFPEFIFCATDLSFGVNWEFRKDKVGDYLAGEAEKPDWKLAKAVAASSCFPPLFGPMRPVLVPAEFTGGAYKGPDRDKIVERLKLSDGGVYDIFGIEPVDRGFVTTIISDAGSPFGYLGTAGPVKRIMRNLPVLMNQIASLRERIFFTHIGENGRSGTLIQIGRIRKSLAGATFDGYVNAKTRSMIAGIRTDLDRFSDAEACILENHGYFETLRQVKAHLSALMDDPKFLGKIPNPAWLDDTLVQAALKRSHSRYVFRFFGFGK